MANKIGDFFFWFGTQIIRLFDFLSKKIEIKRTIETSIEKTTIYLPLIMNNYVFKESEEELADKVLGCDCSHWSGNINFNTMYNAGAKYWITKATDAYVSSPILYEDSKFDTYSKQAQDYGKILTGCFHWLQASVDPKVAADFYLERYNRFKFDFPPILDFEEPNVIYVTKKFSDFSWRAQEWLEYVEAETGRKPIIYTAKWYMDWFDLKYVSWMSKYPLWVADYTWTSNTLGYCTRVPKPWTEYLMWQFSADKNGRGHEFGVDASDIDLNWFPGKYDDLLKYLGKDEIIPDPIPDPIEPEPDPIEDDKAIKFEVISDELNIRTEPKTGSASYTGRKLKKGDMVVFNKSYAPYENWIFDKTINGWVAEKHAGIQYLKRVEE